MKKLLVIMSHNMTKTQKEHAYNTLHISKIIECNIHIKNIWSNINPISSLDLSKLDIVIKWIKENTAQGDYVLVQGEFGATFYIVDYCLKKGLIPIYATSKREVIEEINEEKIITNRIFKHETFRKYVKYEE